MKRAALRGAVLISFTVAASCRPDLGGRPSRVTRLQVLAVRGDPPEASPGGIVRYSLLVATPDGPITTPLASWAYCATPKLLTENGAASAACVTEANAIRSLADGAPAIEATLPADTCAIFGPEIGGPGLRPRDADVTGGYFQPVRVTVVDRDQSAVAFGLERIDCNVADVGADIAREFTARYVVNQNPELGEITATLNDTPVAFDAIPRGARINLRATWSEHSPERYVVYDLASQRIVERRETMRVSWFATAGEFENDRTGRSGEEAETFTENTWQAPADARTTHLFVVLRDARGGVAFTTVSISTR